ncbi:MAG: hypothetical protein AAGK01_09910 [Pseudomonadota bacterium]
MAAMRRPEARKNTDSATSSSFFETTALIGTPGRDNFKVVFAHALLRKRFVNDIALFRLKVSIPASVGPYRFVREL